MINKNKIIPWIPAVIWMCVIFYMSAQPAAESNSISKEIAEKIIKISAKVISLEVDRITINNFVSNINIYVRKSAHFIVYIILGILISFVLNKKGYKNKTFFISFLYCVLFAISDEIHQQYVPGRRLMLQDIILDSMGTLTGIIIYLLAKKSRSKRSSKQIIKNK